MNESIRSLAKESNVYLWQIADALNITDATFSRWLRKELPPQMQETIKGIIDQIKKEAC
jgi:hypothetical protein